MLCYLRNEAFSSPLIYVPLTDSSSCVSGLLTWKRRHQRTANNEKRTAVNSEQRGRSENGSGLFVTRSSFAGSQPHWHSGFYWWWGQRACSWRSVHYIQPDQSHLRRTCSERTTTTTDLRFAHLVESYFSPKSMLTLSYCHKMGNTRNRCAPCALGTGFPPVRDC